MNRNELVLTLLAVAQGRSYTPVQIQKAVFLVTRNLPQVVNEGPSFEFEPYDYGPFDADVYNEAYRLQSKNLATVLPSAGGRWVTYAASDEGVAVGSQILDTLRPEVREYLEKVSAWVRSLPFSGLVKSIYDAYPEMRSNSIFRG